MSLLVLDPGIDDAESLGIKLHHQLTELGVHTIETSNPGVAGNLAAQGSIELVLCCGPDALTRLPSLPRTISTIVIAEADLDPETLLQAMRCGVRDVWRWPLTDNALKDHVSAAQAQVEQELAVLNAEFSSMRTELERDQRAGQYIQMGMLPPNPMGIGHYKLQHRVGPSLILSGDFVDYFQISDRYFACYVADVSGHGASSAFVTVLLKNYSRRLRREYRVSMLNNPGEILQWINTELLDQGIDKHVAMFFGIVDTEQEVLHYANAAHLPPASLVIDGQLATLEQKAKPLGIFPDLEFDSAQVDFPRGAKLVVFSDGVLDLVVGDTLEEKEARLNDAIVATHSMDDLWNTFGRAVGHTSGGPDDVSCLMVEYR